MLEQDDGIVLVHYLAGNLSKTRHSNPAPSPQSSVHVQAKQPVCFGTHPQNPTYGKAVLYLTPLPTLHTSSKCVNPQSSGTTYRGGGGGGTSFRFQI